MDILATVTLAAREHGIPFRLPVPPVISLTRVSEFSVVGALTSLVHLVPK